MYDQIIARISGEDGSEYKSSTDSAPMGDFVESAKNEESYIFNRDRFNDGLLYNQWI